jgi:hypothetical protein
MKLFEVFLELINGNRRIGRTSIQVQARSPFTAASQAEKLIDSQYGDAVYSHTLKVNSLSHAEYRFSIAA